MTADIHSRFGRDRWWDKGGGTGGHLGGSSAGGGFGTGAGSLVSEIHSHFRPRPPRVPLGPPEPIGYVTFGPVTITYSPQHKVVVPGG